MAIAENLAPNEFVAMVPTYDAAAGGYNLYARSLSDPQSMVSGFSSAALSIHMLALVFQIWANAIVPLQADVIAVSAVFEGSGFFGVGEQVSAAEFIMLSAPAGAGNQPGEMSRWPHVGQWCFAYASAMGGLTLEAAEYLQWQRQIIFPKRPLSGTIYFRMNPGYSGVFVLYDNATKRTGTTYQWAGGPIAPCNPYANTPVLQEPV